MAYIIGQIIGMCFLAVAWLSILGIAVSFATDMSKYYDGKLPLPALGTVILVALIAVGGGLLIFAGIIGGVVELLAKLL